MCKCNGCKAFVSQRPKPEMLSHSEAAGWSSLYPMSQYMTLRQWERDLRASCISAARQDLAIAGQRFEAAQNSGSRMGDPFGTMPEALAFSASERHLADLLERYPD